LKSKRGVGDFSPTPSSEGRLKINGGSFKNQRNIDSLPDSSLSSQPSLSPSLSAQDDAVSSQEDEEAEKLEGVSPLAAPATRMKPARTELTDAQKERARALKSKIEDRCGVLTSKGPNIGENQAIAKLVQKYADADIDDVEQYLLHCHFKWSKPDFKYKIRGNILLEEMEPTLRLFAENPKMRDATGVPPSKPAQAVPAGITYKRLPPAPSRYVVVR
jgi:hypothetical protein